MIDGDCSAVGRTLAEMNLRGLTGATVLAIARSSGQEQQLLVPTGHERLRAGDVLAIAGPRDSVAAACDLLQAS